MELIVAWSELIPNQAVPGTLSTSSVSRLKQLYILIMYVIKDSLTFSVDQISRQQKKRVT